MDPTGIASLAPFLAVLVPLFVLGVFAIVGIIVFFALRRSGVFTQLGRAVAAGVPSPQQVEAERTGRVAQALVLDVNELESVAKNRVMVYHRAALVLEVRVPGYAPYRAPCEQWFISSKWLHIAQGTLVPVRIDVHDPQRVFVDEAAMDRATEAAELAKREEHARRQAELLSGNRR